MFDVGAFSLHERFALVPVPPALPLVEHLVDDISVARSAGTRRPFAALPRDTARERGKPERSARIHCDIATVRGSRSRPCFVRVMRELM